MTRWTVLPEHFDSPDATALRRDYYADVAGSYWGRPATNAEVDEGLADDGVARLGAPTGGFVVGRHDGEPAACGGVLLLDSERAELTRVFVRPAFRGTGGGAALLTALEEAARRLGARRMVLNTRLDLVGARTLYARHGYREIPAYCEGPYMEIWYGKELTLGEPVPREGDASA
ncbi:GNAT family N-acetyltransferase [Streptomyces sp. WMMC940]|uniref:GNAT family N-acetyltransferase n=1 Tax=Streptomyces sp. WMMC940 TaxID=3015153 RepID=UPI0022B7183D|nr:GNAT family N-acetyltransferase [Streptomyces sp. WMMC940]MCZ7460522.1 GNAT family N-acetyltransferase [Streptomyces sp. WMMC940]